MASEIRVPPHSWQIDGLGYIYTVTGCKAARVDADGTVWLWDKRAKVEVPLTSEMIYELTYTLCNKQ